MENLQALLSFSMSRIYLLEAHFKFTLPAPPAL